MTKILPMMFAFPALIIAFMNIFFDMEDILGSFLGLDTSGLRRGESRDTFAPWVGDLNHEHPYIDIDDDLGDGEESSMHFPSIDRKDIQFPNQSQKTMHESIGLTEIALWHDRLLKWAATKTTGLGINAGYGKTQGQDPGYRASVAFDIQPFFPSFELMPLIMYRLIRLSQEALGNVLVALSNTNSESLKSLRSTVRKRKYENKWMQKRLAQLC